MVALEPDLEEVFELPILSDVARRKVAVVIEDRLVFGVVVEEFSRRGALKQEIVVDKWQW